MLERQPTRVVRLLVAASLAVLGESSPLTQMI